eukprot:COSAG02_NODE_41334_length_395_cov_2.574324_1_plen_66_part_10
MVQKLVGVTPHHAVQDLGFHATLYATIVATSVSAARSRVSESPASGRHRDMRTPLQFRTWTDSQMK